VLTALLVGTVLTVEAAKVDLGRLNIVAALGIATIKMTLVILFSCTANTVRDEPSWSS